jgi:tetratricopeptide (TPR) repeat protein
MKDLGAALLFLAHAPLLAEHSAAQADRPAVLLPGLSHHHHPVSTSNKEAQQFFDQGLTLLFAFNHDEAARSFARAAELDPELAMAWWGLALVRGPNYNLDTDEKQQKAAHEALQKALKVAEKGSTPPQDRDYIRALSRRYDPDPKADRMKLASAYKEAMGELARKYPDDLDVATLYAESAMNLRPWKLWSADGKPAEGTEEILAVLEAVLRRNPKHPGANHYYIHAVEASPHPERALPAADRLMTLVPGAGHLVHMPAHIYIRVGDYAAAAKSNERAIAADRAYIKQRQVTGVYPMMYYSHNFHFLAVARALQGRSADAKKAADQLADHVGHHVEEMPMLEGFLTVPPMLLARFQRWEDILAAELPGEKLKLTRAAWHLARALAHLGKDDPRRAEQEREKFLALKKELPADVKLSDWNTAQDVLDIAELVLDARAALKGKDRVKAISLLRRAVKKEDALHYGEPPDWLLPVRETLGAVLLLSGELEEAEKVFRAGLEKTPRNGRCLFGLRETLRLQKKTYAAQLVEQEFREAWKEADVKELRLEEF